jgi:DedD protein
MATPNYTEEEILFRRRARRRLVGAVVLVVTVIAVVPIILPESKPQQETQQIEIRIPAQDATGYAPKITPAPSVESAVTPAPASNLAPVATPNSQEEAKPSVKAPQEPSVALPVKQEKPQALVPEAAKPVTAPVKAVSEPAKASATTKPSAAAKQTYFVQYGAFSEQKNAKQRQAELKAKGISTFTEVVKTSAGNKIRVRSGPYAAREDAEKIRVKVKPLDTKLVVMGNTP